MDIAIRAEGLSKQYRLGEREAYGALRDSIARAMRAPLRAFSRKPADEKRLLWALRDVSFDLHAGDILGIVGRNGSGKSTLLKILSRITEPTSGRAVVSGRIGALLEVGTGFHPELTGRENVFVNGAILGMPRVEIARKFDEIVAFADVERFIDTPVKFYSSGMQMRLAFAVAAHLEPDILLVDEVLAVGDIAFQRKCLGKLNDVSRDGRTILFVSHQMNQLRRLCTKCLWLDSGRLVTSGATGDVLGQYEASFRRSAAQENDRDRGGVAKWRSWQVGGPDDSAQHTIGSIDPMSVSFQIRVWSPLRKVRHGIALLSPSGQNLWGTAIRDLDLTTGEYIFTHRLPIMPLQPGVYTWQVSLYSDEGMIDLWDCLPEMIVTTPPLTHYRDEYAGLLNMPTGFQMSRTTDRDTAPSDSAVMRA